jgi:UDP-3-O-[3-hydroxymyristoyl] glucosamine N-acyltransferase
MKLSELTEKGDLELVIDGEFQSLGKLSYNYHDQLVFIEDAKYIAGLLKKNNVSSVITTKEMVSSIPKGLGIAYSKSPRISFYAIHDYLAKETDFYWKNFKTKVASTAIIHHTAYVAENNVRIGERCTIGPNVSILENTILENDVTVSAGTVIGAQGFEFNRMGEKILSVIHAGGVLLHERVEIQSNCSIDKALFGNFTEIGEDTKLDNLVHIAHNVIIGKRCFLAACVMVAGSVTVGNDVWIGPSASLSTDVVIGNRASITIGSVVVKDVPDNQKVTGNFAIDHKKFIALIRRNLKNLK